MDTSHTLPDSLLSAAVALLRDLSRTQNTGLPRHRIRPGAGFQSGYGVEGSFLAPAGFGNGIPGGKDTAGKQTDPGLTGPARAEVREGGEP